jgi:LysM repeat protein
LLDTLGAAKTQRVSAWLLRRWRTDQRSSFSHTQSLILPSLTAWQLDPQETFFWPVWPSISLPNPPGLMARQYPRSYEVWATRYDAGDRYVIALPDKCLKFANAGSMLCNDGYQYNQNYSVAISYKGNLVVATVAESGPWNVDDNYWSSSKDPQPRRMFTDLPQGVPEAQAAFYNGYNSGLDQFGRKVTSPVAIDISYKVAKDLGLPAGNNQVTISFLWTEGWDAPKPNKPKNSTPDKPIENSPGVIRFAVSTPNPDGSIVHVVQSGQTLVGVANVYGIPLQDLLKLNNLSMESIIHPGDTLLIKEADATPTLAPTASPQATMTRVEPSPTLESKASPTLEVSQTPTAAPQPAAQVNPPILRYMLVGGICFLAGGLVVWVLGKPMKRNSHL